MKLAERIYITAHGQQGECMPQKMALQQFALHQIYFIYSYHNCVTTEYVFAINPV